MFELKSEYKPAGDQIKAIDALSRGILKGDKEQTLLGVTGSGKTFTIANPARNHSFVSIFSKKYQKDFLVSQSFFTVLHQLFLNLLK